MPPPHHPPRTGPPRFPERVGRYEILLPIASGGMATVYLARAVGAGDGEPDVALKLTHAHLRQEKDFAHHLVEEAKLAAGIHHPNVVSVLDVGDDPMGIYLVMEFVDGDTLGNMHQYVQKLGRPLSVPVGMRVLLDGLAGLHAAHQLSGADGRQQGLVHRDFTPQNILVGLDGAARLTDFGIAKAATRLGHTGTGIVKGKIAYMSPEQARGHPLDRRADVFSAGVIAWELVANRRLHECETDVELLLKVVSEEAPLLSTVARDVPPALEQAIASAVALDRDVRCPSAEEFATRLRQATEDAGLLASHEQVAHEIRRLLGAKLERRQQRIRESLAVRSRRSALAAATEASEPFTPSDPSSAVDPPSHVAEVPTLANRAVRPRMWAGPPLNTPLPDEVTLQSEPSVRSFSRPEVPLPPRSDENSSTDSVAIQSPTPPNRALPVRLWVAIALGAVMALAVIVPLAFIDFRSEHVTPDADVGQLPPPASAAPVPTPTASSPVASVSASSSPRAPTPARRQVEIHANAKITALLIGNQEIPPGQPSVVMHVVLEPTDGEGSLRVHATAIDGRTARARLEPDQSRLTLQFLEAPGSPRVHPTEKAPPHLAPNPYGK
jgi:serine/threonine protein kinase